MLTLHNNRGVEEKHGQQSLNIKMNTEHELRTFFPCFIRIPVITEKKHDEISSCFHYFSYLFAFIWVCWTVSLAKVLSIRLVFQFTAKHRRKQKKTLLKIQINIKINVKDNVHPIRNEHWARIIKITFHTRENSFTRTFYYHCFRIAMEFLAVW